MKKKVLMVSEENKILFNKRFEIFWQKLTEKEKREMTDEKKEYYKSVMYNHFSELLKFMDVDKSLYYVFHIPIAIINLYEITSHRVKPEYPGKYFKKVIKYFLENEVSEYRACKYIFENENNLRNSDKSFESFKTAFRKWYKNIWNQDSNPEIYQYLDIFRQRKPRKKQQN